MNNSLENPMYFVDRYNTILYTSTNKAELFTFISEFMRKVAKDAYNYKATKVRGEERHRLNEEKFLLDNYIADFLEAAPLEGNGGYVLVEDMREMIDEVNSFAGTAYGLETQTAVQGGLTKDEMALLKRRARTAQNMLKEVKHFAFILNGLGNPMYVPNTLPKEVLATLRKRTKAARKRYNKFVADRSEGWEYA